MSYSFSTSYPAYQENLQFNKRTQCDEVLGFILKGANNLLQISEASGIPQAIVSARVSDLINESKIEYRGFTVYKNRKRKRIVAIKVANNIHLQLKLL